MENNLIKSNSELWCLTCDNFYTYDSGERKKAVFVNEEDAFNEFKKIVKSYYFEELGMAQEIFGKEDITTFAEIVKEIDNFNHQFALDEEYLEVGNVSIKHLQYAYGVELLEGRKKFTILRNTEQLLKLNNYDEDRFTEEVCVLLEKISIGELSGGTECTLDNYADVDLFIKENI